MYIQIKNCVPHRGNIEVIRRYMWFFKTEVWDLC